MDEMDELEQIAKEHRQAKATLNETRRRLAAAVVAAARAKRKQSEIVRITGYSRERVRQICRAAGLEPE